MGASWPPSVINMLLDAWAAAIGSPAFVTSTFEEITGTPALSFQKWASIMRRNFVVKLYLAYLMSTAWIWSGW